MNQIASSAIIEDGVILGDNNVIDERTIIRKGCVIGDNNTIGPNVLLGPNVTIQNNNKIYFSAYLGGDPQDVAFKGGISYISIGSGNIIREFTTIHRGTAENTTTVIGDNNFLMANVHIGHNCIVHDNCILTNSVGLGGYSVIGNHVVMGGLSGAHQFVHIGDFAMIGANAFVTMDILPFALGYGTPAKVLGVNTIGLKRNNIVSTDLDFIRKLFHEIYNNGKSLSRAIIEIEETYKENKYAGMITEFYKNSKRGLAQFGYKNNE